MGECGGAGNIADGVDAGGGSLAVIADADITDIEVVVDDDPTDSVREYTLTSTAETPFCVTVNGKKLEADGMLLNEDGSLNAAEADKTLDANAYVQPLQGPRGGAGCTEPRCCAR